MNPLNFYLRVPNGDADESCAFPCLVSPPLRSRFQARLVDGLSNGCEDAHLAPMSKESMQRLIKALPPPPCLLPGTHGWAD